MMPFIDTHIHLDYLTDPHLEVREANAVGVEQFIVPGTAIERWNLLLDTVAAIPQALAAPGVHPLAAAGWRPPHHVVLAQLLSRPQIVAIGEVGLDKQAKVSKEVQEQVFRQMLRTAVDNALPLLIHCRGATGRLLEIIGEEQANRVGGIFHAFSGSLETARRVIDLNFALGIGGVVTYPGAHRLPEVVKQVPAECLVLETDAPDMAPHPHRGQQNRAANLRLVAEAVARIRQWSLEETARITTANAQRILGI